MVTSDGLDYFGSDLCGVIAIGGSLGIGLGSGLGFWLKNNSSRLHLYVNPAIYEAGAVAGWVYVC